MGRHTISAWIFLFLAAAMQSRAVYAAITIEDIAAIYGPDGRRIAGTGPDAFTP